MHVLLNEFWLGLLSVILFMCPTVHCIQNFFQDQIYEIRTGLEIDYSMSQYVCHVKVRRYD